MSDRFYSPVPLPLGEALLSGSEVHHLAAVRRFEPGDHIILFTGDGLEYHAEILSLGKKQALLHVHRITPVDRELGFSLSVAAALPKGDRGDMLIEKLTELGTTRFIPLITQRTIVHPRESRMESLRRTVIEASKQCGRNVLMHVDDPIAWDAFLAANHGEGQRFILHPCDNAMSLDGKANTRSDVILAVGPEGGFTDEEVAGAIERGWVRMGLGPRILRVETAAIAAVVNFV